MVTNRFMHIHLPHTGGGALHTFYTKWKGIKVLDRTAHQSYDWMANCAVHHGLEIPPAFVFVRNPWRWNVSMWTWVHQRCLGRKQPGSLRFDKTDRTFEDFLDVRAWCEETGTFDLNFSGLSGAWKCLQGFKAQHIGRTEFIVDDAARILTNIMGDLVDEDEVRRCVVEAGKTNQVNEPGKDHPHSPYQEYYTDVTRDLVGQWESFIIRGFDYSFVDGPSGP